MDKRAFYSLAPNLTTAGGHMTVYQNCLEIAASQLGLKFSVLFPKRFADKVPGNWTPFFYTNRMARWFDFCRLFRKKEAKVVFLESFNTTDLLVFTLAALLFARQTDQICLLYRYGLVPISVSKKAHIFLNRILKMRCRDRLRMLTDSELVAQEYAGYIRCQMFLLPIPHTERVNASNKERAKIVCWWPGAPRAAKGWAELRYLAPFLREAKNIELVAAKQSCLPHTTLIADVLTREEYIDHLQNSDCILLPYDAGVYRSGTSGIFVETIVAGKIPLVKEGSWLAYELKKYQLSELLVDWGSPTFFDDLLEIVKSVSIREKLRNMQLVYAQFHSQENFTETLLQIIQE
jgi:hypothetical protein